MPMLNWRLWVKGYGFLHNSVQMHSSRGNTHKRNIRGPYPCHTNVAALFPMSPPPPSPCHGGTASIGDIGDTSGTHPSTRTIAHCAIGPVT